MILTLIYFIFILGVIIVVHEFGHFIFAKIFGVYVYEFSLGMGPKLWGTKEKKGKTTFNIRAIPIGGFCSLAGEEVDPKEKIPENQRLYKKPKWQRFLILFFGAGNNFILALFVLFVLGLFVGSPDMTPVVRNLDEKYPMYEAGIREGDIFVKINNKEVSTIDDVQVYLIMAQKNEESTFVMKHDGKEVTYKVTPKEEKTKEGTAYKFGVVFETKMNHGFVSAVKYSFVKFGALIKQMCIVIKSLFTKELGFSSLSGPVGIYTVVDQAKSTGFSNIIYLIALLSVNVGFVNLIPFPAFDGGRILFLIIEAIKGSPVSPKVENAFNTVGFILLMILMLVITVNDIFRII